MLVGPAFFLSKSRLGAFALILLLGLVALAAGPISGSEAQRQPARPDITELAVVDGTTLSLAGAPKAFPNGAATVYLRGRVEASATRVMVRVEDFFSELEWHPNRACPRRPVATCVDGSMEKGRRASSAGLGRARNGTKPFTFKGELPDGMYRLTVFARQGRGRPGVIEKRWFKVNRGATAFASRSQVLVTRPADGEAIAARNARGNTPFRVVTTAASTELDWSLRQDETGTFYNQDVDAFRRPVTNHRRLFDGWQSVDFGRTFFNWDVSLSKGRYTMWLTAIDGLGRKGLTTKKTFVVS